MQAMRQDTGNLEHRLRAGLPAHHGACQEVTRPKRPRGQLTKPIIDIATGGQPEHDPNAGTNPAAVELGKKGGKARAKAMKRRAEIARKAAQKR
jgi:hypothetical protein